jgi:predicted nuclease with RNAse H fold
MDGSNDTHLGMKKLALHNWREPDMPNVFPGLPEDMWVAEALKPQLAATVPEEVIRLFEVARGSILYGWFFYPLHTLASEQLHRVQEAAVRARCKIAGIPLNKTLKGGRTISRSFADLIGELTGRGIIRRDERGMWDATRKLRNMSSHPERQMITPPGYAIAEIELAARRINQLFDKTSDFHSVLGQYVRKATGIGSNRGLPIVVGIDVGESRKGFHLVALRDTLVVGKLKTSDPSEAAAWCLGVEAKMVGVDAPSGWCNHMTRGRREAEELIAIMGYSSFPTPRREVAVANPVNAWMLNGERLYAALRSNFPLFNGKVPDGRFCFETYPYLASCGLACRRLEAKNKLHDRRDIIRSAGINDQTLTNGDFLDAAICAMAACSVAINYVTMCGNAEEGYIVAPCYH